MKLRIPSAVLVLVLACSNALAQGSDSCAGAQPISGTGSFAFDTTSATTGVEGQSNALCNQSGSAAIERDVWFGWTAPFTGVAEITSCGQTGLDTKIAVYAGSGCPSAAPLACNDDFCGTQSYLTVPVTAGSTYTIQVGHYTGTPGGLATFALVAQPASTNDDCGSPSVITGNGPFAFDLNGATTGAVGQTNSICRGYGTTSIAFDRWFRWTAPATGSARVTFCGSVTGDVRAAVYAGGTCPVGAAIACADDVCGNEPIVGFSCVAGQDYMIQVGARPGTGTASGSFSVLLASGTSYSGLNHVPIGGAALMPNGFGGLTVGGIGSSGQDGVCVQLPPDVLHSFCIQLATSTCPFTSSASTPAGTALSLTATNALQQFAAYLSFTSNGSNVDITADFGSTIATFCNEWTGVSVPGPTYVYDECEVPGAPFEIRIPNDACIEEIDWHVWNTLKSGFGILFDSPTTVTFGSGVSYTCDRVTVYPDDLSTAGGPLIFASGGMPPIDSFTVLCSTLGSFDIAMEVIDPPLTTGTPYCFGDGTGVACPCGNVGAAGNGCANSLNANGASLVATGTPSLAADSVVLQGSGMPNSSCLYFQGTTQVNAGSGVAFGDGLRCVGGSIVRLRTTTNVAGASQYPAGAQPSVSVKGLVTAPGTRNYQCWYRNAGAFCTSATFNLTNGCSITWNP